jgi:hypothetical protein
MVALEDAETGETLLVDTGDEQVRTAYRVRSEKKFEQRLSAFKASNIDYIDIRTETPYIDTLLKFFRMREKRL